MRVDKMMRSLWYSLFILVVVLPCSSYGESISVAKSTEGKVTGGQFSEHPDWFKESFLDIADDVDEATESGKHIMLFMHLNGCPYCFKMVEENIKNAPYTDFIKVNFDVIAINIQGDREVAFNEEVTLKEKALAKMLKVQFTPTIIFLDSNNRVVQRLNGYRTRSAFKYALNFVKEREYKQTTLSQYIERQKAEKTYSFREHPQLKSITNLQRVADKPLVVLFEDKWCSEACNTLHDRYLNQPETLKILNNFTFVRLDAASTTSIVDVEGNKTTAKAYAEKLGLSYRPGIVMFDRGKEIQRIDGMLYGFHFQESLRYVGERGYEQYDYRQFMRNRTQAILESGQNIDLSK